jgi:peptidoglycan/xylan/chitin deacetylase (PgdA/CDA1 family)
MAENLHINRRQFLRDGTIAGVTGASLMGGAVATGPNARASSGANQAMVAISLDLEMCRNFPNWDDLHWDYEKGNLNAETKRYALEAARRVKQAGGVVHFFALGQTFEQPDIGWLREIVDAGHSVGSHTYDHINVTATKTSDVQFRFQRAPWLLRGQTVAEAIRENLSLTNLAFQSRLGIRPNGFRTPGGFANGLRDQANVRAIIREMGFDWVSSLYPSHPYTDPMQEPSALVIDGIVAAQAMAQPFIYADDDPQGNLIEIPMSPISDIGAFRTGRWQLEWFLTAIRESLRWCIDQGRVFDLLAHPACLYVTDPEFKVIELVCDMVRQSGERAKLVDLAGIANTVRS